jgi:hypothetical protein
MFADAGVVNHHRPGPMGSPALTVADIPLTALVVAVGKLWI